MKKQNKNSLKTTESGSPKSQKSTKELIKYCKERIKENEGLCSYYGKMAEILSESMGYDK